MSRIKLVGRVDRRTPIWWWGPKRRARWREDREAFIASLSDAVWNPRGSK